MKAIDLTIDLLIDAGCNYYTTTDHDVSIFPHIRKVKNELHVSVHPSNIWDVVFHGHIILSSQRYYLGEFNANPVYRFDLTDPSSIPKLELFIKNMLT